MNFYDRHIGDYLKNTLSLSMLEDGAYNRLLDYYYSEESALPKNIKEIYKISRAISKKEREAVDVILNKFFTLFDDGYHQKRCDEVIEKFYENKPKSDEKKANARERQKRARERREALFAELRGFGITAPWNTTTTDLEAALANAKQDSNSKPVTPPVTEPVTRDITATNTHSPFPNTHIKTKARGDVVEDTSKNTARTLPGEICKALLDIGITDVNPTYPTLIALCDAGATLEEFKIAGMTAKQKSKGFRYVIGTVKGQRDDAANAKLVKGSFKQDNWRKNDDTIVAKARELKIGTSGLDRFQLIAKIEAKLEETKDD